MKKRDTWRDRLIEEIALLALRLPNDVQDVAEVVCMAKGPFAESYYKGLSETGVRKLVREIKEVMEAYRQAKTESTNQ